MDSIEFMIFLKAYRNNNNYLTAMGREDERMYGKKKREEMKGKEFQDFKKNKQKDLARKKENGSIINIIISFLVGVCKSEEQKSTHCLKCTVNHCLFA